VTCPGGATGRGVNGARATEVRWCSCRVDGGKIIKIRLGHDAAPAPTTDSLRPHGAQEHGRRCIVTTREQHTEAAGTVQEKVL
jgi:hypothetical protein